MVNVAGRRQLVIHDSRSVIVQGVETLKSSAQFERVRREGRSWGSGLLVLNAARNGSDTVRCGFITGKKIGKAVQRNRARRLLREAVRGMLPAVKPGWDLVWIARPGLAQADFQSVVNIVGDLLQRGRIIDPQASETSPAASRIINVAEDGERTAHEPESAVDRATVENPGGVGEQK